jgi:hypothetical protein
MLGTHAGAHEFIAQVQRMGDVDGKGDGAAALANLYQCVTMSPMSLGSSMRSASCSST